MNAEPTPTSTGRRTFEISHCRNCSASIRRPVWTNHPDPDTFGPWRHTISDNETCGLG